MSDWPVVGASRYVEDDAPSTSYLTTITASGSANVKGAWTTVIAALPFDIAALLLKVEYASGGDHLFDIGIGGAGSEVVIVPNVFCGATGGFGAGNFFNMGLISIPFPLPKNTRIAIRLQSNPGSLTIRVRMQFVAANFPHFPGLSKAAAIGVTDSGATAGTLITSVAGNAKTAWVELSPGGISFTTKHVLWTGFANTGTAADWNLDLGIGPVGGELAVLPNVFYRWRTVGYTECWSIPLVLPKGTRVVARLNASVNALPFRVGAVLLG